MQMQHAGEPALQEHPHDQLAHEEHAAQQAQELLAAATAAAMGGAPEGMVLGAEASAGDLAAAAAGKRTAGGYWTATELHLGLHLPNCSVNPNLLQEVG